VIQNGVTTRAGRSDHSTGTTSIPQNRINISTLANIRASFSNRETTVLVADQHFAMVMPWRKSVYDGELPMNRGKL